MKKLRKLFVVFLLLLGSGLVTVGLLYTHYASSVGTSDEEIKVVIESGTGDKIGRILKENNLIHNELFFKLYIRFFKIDDLKAGTYLLKNNMDLKEIIEILQKGTTYNENEISITFNEGINMRKIAKTIENNTSNSYDEVMNLNNDKEYLQELIDEYWFIDKDILNSKIYYPLEGYLYPDTYRFDSKDVSVKYIFKKLLKKMDEVLSPYQKEIENSELNVHELLTLASIAELEVNKKEDRGKVVSVFLNRLDKKMSLGSDITTRYSIKLDDTRALTKKEYNSVNDYNTRSSTMAGRLPVGPIGTVSKESIIAAINPEETDYLYFISNIKTNETFFFARSSDFEKKKQELKSVNNGY